MKVIHFNFDRFMSSPNRKSVYRRDRNRVDGLKPVQSDSLNHNSSNLPKALPAPIKGIPKPKNKPNFFAKIMKQYEHEFEGKTVDELFNENKLNVNLDKLREHVRNKENKNSKEENNEVKEEYEEIEENQMKDHEQERSDDDMMEFQLQIKDSQTFIDSLFA